MQDPCERCRESSICEQTCELKIEFEQYKKSCEEIRCRIKKIMARATEGEQHD